MSKHADQQIVDLPIPSEDGRVRHKRTTGKEPQCARRWTKEDDAFVARHCDSMTDATMAVVLGRSRNSIGLRRQRITQVLKAERPQKWTAEQDFMLAKLYGKVDSLFLAAVIGRTARALHERVSCLGLQIKNLWSPEEDVILREHFPYAPVTQFAHLLPARGPGSIYDRADTLALSRDPSYMLRTSKGQRFRAYPPELQSLIQLLNQVERKLQDVQAQH